MQDQLCTLESQAPCLRILLRGIPLSGIPQMWDTSQREALLCEHGVAFPVPFHKTKHPGLITVNQVGYVPVQREVFSGIARGGGFTIVPSHNHQVIECFGKTDTQDKGS